MCICACLLQKYNDSLLEGEEAAEVVVGFLQRNLTGIEVLTGNLNVLPEVKEVEELSNDGVIVAAALVLLIFHGRLRMYERVVFVFFLVMVIEFGSMNLILH